MTRLLVAGPNLTVDRTSTLSALQPGAVLRTRTVHVAAGGKGVNVVRTAIRLDATTTLIGFLAGHTGRAAAGMLADEGIDVVGVEVEGETRSTLVLTDDRGAVTVINEPGPSIGVQDWARYERALDDRLEDADWLVCSGSCPPGGAHDAYARLCRMAADRGVPTLVDASGDLLGGCVDAGATVVAPNLAEAEALLFGTATEEVEMADDAKPRALGAAERLADAGAKLALVSAGRHGVAAADTRSTMWVDAPEAELVHPIGAGDVLSGAFAVHWRPGQDLVPALVKAVAAAAASVEHPKAGCFDRPRAAELEDVVQV